MLHQKIKIVVAMLGIALVPTISYGQNVDLGNFKDNFSRKNLAKINGGINANAIVNAGNGTPGRNPFDYFITGNLNLNLFNTINLPFSFNFTSLGGGGQYPTLPNRLSLHPTYKWVGGHVGDVSMSFSPYTLNGHQFTGVGVDLEPEGRWKVSGMYGRLLRPVETDTTNPSVLASYKRMGYGTKLQYSGETYRVGFIAFAAKDDPNSLINKPDSFGIYPQQNLVMSWNGAYKPAKNIEFIAEYATSAMTRDRRDTTKQGSLGNSYIKFLVAGRNNTFFYHAAKFNLNYTFLKNIVGFGYERVDPGYETLGAYFFNNDLRNITVNCARPFLKDKMQLAVNVGVQRDNLNNEKSGTNNRFVGALNFSYAVNDRLNTSLNYSSFQTHMFIRPQFLLLNQLNPLQNLDTLNFTQISQNAAINIDYQFPKNDRRMQSINTNLSFFDARDKQGNVMNSANASQFYNFTAAHNIFFTKRNYGFTTALNASYNTVGTSNFLIVGPTAGVNAKFLNKKLTTGLLASYNISQAQGAVQAKIFNTRFNASYALNKKHVFNINVVNQLRNIANRGRLSDMILNLSYNYNF